MLQASRGTKSIIQLNIARLTQYPYAEWTTVNGNDLDVDEVAGLDGYSQLCTLETTTTKRQI